MLQDKNQLDVTKNIQQVLSKPHQWYDGSNEKKNS